MEFSKEQKQRAFQQLPDDVRSAITSVETGEAIDQIGRKYQLHIDKLGLLEKEIYLVMLGLKQVNDLAEDVKKQLQLSEEQANEIVKEVNDQIFLKIRESLKEIRSQEEKTEEAESPQRQTESPQEERQTEKAPAATEMEQKEGAPPPNLPTGNISSLKLGGMFKVPQEAKESSAATDESPKQQTPSDYEADPYREPIK